MHPHGDLDLPFIDFPASEGFIQLPAGKQKFDPFFICIGATAGRTSTCSASVISSIPHKPEENTEFLPTSAVFSLWQVLNQNMSASIHTGDHFTLNALARHHNKKECITQTYFFAVSFIHKGSFNLHHVVIIVTVIPFFHVIPHLSPFLFHQNHEVPQSNTQQRHSSPQDEITK